MYAWGESMILGDRIKICRKAKNMTQDELGQLIGVSKVSICQWEKGIKTPSTKNLIELTKLFNVELSYLIGNDIYVVSEKDDKYSMYMSKEEIEILREIKKHDILYKDFLDNPSRVIERIKKKLY